jgi:hypothetical protein
MLDVSQPERPRPLLRCALRTGRRLAVTTGYLAAYDFSDPTGMALAQQRPGAELFRLNGRTCPEPLAPIPTSRVNGLVMDSGYLFAAVHLDGIEIFDLADPHQPKLLARSDPLGTEPTSRTDYFDLALQGRILLAAVGNVGLLRLDVQDPAAPGPATVHAEWCASDRVVARDGFVLLSCRAGVTLLDVTTPTAPRMVTYGTLHGTIAAGEGGRFYVADASRDVWELRAVRHGHGLAP